MNKWLALMLFVVSARAALASPADPKNALFEEVERMCSPTPQTHCWQKAAQMLSQMSPALTEREHEDQLFAYWYLGKVAYLVGDLADARLFYDDAARVISRKGPSVGKADSTALRAILDVDEAELAKSMRDYGGTLILLDRFAAFQMNNAEQTIAAEATLMLRCGALIGLRRHVDECLQNLLKRLDFAGDSPWGGVLIGVQPLNPYQAARRIAGYFTREGKFDQALTLIQELESARKATLARSPAQAGFRKPWAALVNPVDILDDQAAVYMAQGNDVAAEPLLREAMALSEKTPGPPLKRTLIGLAQLSLRTGRTQEAAALMARAEALIQTGETDRSDPLALTLGLPR